MYQNNDYRNYLMHHGILGMKWGVRRYQNPDGSLTSEGKRHLKADTETVHASYSKEIQSRTKYAKAQLAEQNEIAILGKASQKTIDARKQIEKENDAIEKQTSKVLQSFKETYGNDYYSTLMKDMEANKTMVKGALEATSIVKKAAKVRVYNIYYGKESGDLDSALEFYKRHAEMEKTLKKY